MGSVLEFWIRIDEKTMESRDAMSGTGTGTGTAMAIQAVHEAA